MKTSFKDKWVKFEWVLDGDTNKKHSWKGLIEEDNLKERQKDKRIKRKIKVLWFKKGSPPDLFIKNEYEYEEFAELINQGHFEIVGESKKK